MALQGAAANSRLAEMQMRFQKKQMLEREQKKLALTGGEISQATKTSIGNGKVRQMFDDRRRGVGIDRSHPLRPIVASSISTQQSPANKRVVGGQSVTKRHVIENNTLTPSTTPTTGNSNLSIINCNTSIFNNNLDELDSIDNETFPKEFSTLSLNNTHILSSSSINDVDFDDNYNEESGILGETIVISKNTSHRTNSIKLNPVITKKSPVAATNTTKLTAVTTAKSNSRTPSSSRRVSTLSKATANTIKSPFQKAATPPSLTATKSSKTTGTKLCNTKPATFALSVKPPPRISTPPPGMTSCQYCHRNFNEERLAKHEEVCGKMTTKKRKVFDASKHRVKGTEAEKYLKKGKVLNSSTTKTVPIKTTQAATSSSEKKSNWRKKHEEFIAAIREAKKVQAHLAKGGKLSDLPPPPPSENPDYVQCPHCSRRFNEAAAERHIPKCANMKHNKPKPPQKKRF